MSKPLTVAVDNDRAPAPRFLVVDGRVPEAVRQLLEEADGCLNMSFTVGGTACVRRAIRVIVEGEGISGDDYSASLIALSQKHPGVAPTLFQILDLLGSGDEPLQPDALKVLTATVKGVVYEVYVLGAERIESLEYLRELMKALDRGKLPVKLSKSANKSS